MKRRLKITFFSLAGLAVSAAFANFPGFRHAVIPIRKGAAKPLYIRRFSDPLYRCPERQWQ